MIINLSRDSLLQILDEIGIDIRGETTQDFIAYCPFHLNRDSAALNIGIESPYPFRCWNPACGVSGTLPKLVEVAGDMGPMEALRFLYRHRDGTSVLEKILERNEEAPYEPWSETMLDRVRIDYDNDTSGVVLYMLSRGFSLDTIQEFEIGYSKVKDRVVIPVRDIDGSLVGFSGRALRPDQEPRYWDKGLPKRYLLFNINKAKEFENVIVVEGPLDAMKVYQAGYKNVIAIFGGGFSKEQQALLTHRFSSCIIFTDNPEVDVSRAGEALTHKISGVMRKAGRQVFIAPYPSDVKDPGDMSEQQIVHSIENAESILKYKLRVLGGNVK